MRTSLNSLLAFAAAFYGMDKRRVPPAKQTAVSREFHKARAQAKRERKAKLLRANKSMGRVE